MRKIRSPSGSRAWGGRLARPTNKVEPQTCGSTLQVIAHLYSVYYF